jgi:hypothetical protein
MPDRDAFDLFSFLGQLNRRNLHAYDQLSDEGKKAAHPLVIMRWLSGTTDQAQIVRLNEFVNRYVFSMGTDKGLLFKLLASACTGNTARTKWIKGPSSSSTRLALEAIKSQFQCSTREAEQYLGMLEPTDIVRYAEAAGWDKDALKKLDTELGKENGTGQGSTPKNRRKSKS